MDQPLVSVVVPVYNGEEYIFDAVESVLRQTYSNIEVVIVNNNSTDSTKLELERFSNISNVKVVNNETTLSPGDNWNLGLKMAKGEYVKMLCHDDMLLPTCISRHVEIFQTYPEVSLSSSYERFFGNKSGVRKIGPIPYIKLIHENSKILTLFYGNWLGGPSGVMFKAKFIKKHLFNPKYLGALDVDMWIRLALEGSIYVISECLYKTRIHKNQLTNLCNSEDVFELECIVIAYNLLFDKKNKINFFKRFSVYIFSTNNAINALIEKGVSFDRIKRFIDNWGIKDPTIKFRYNRLLSNHKKVVVSQNIFLNKVLKKIYFFKVQKKLRKINRKLLLYLFGAKGVKFFNNVKSIEINARVGNERVNTISKVVIPIKKIRCRIWTPGGLKVMRVVDTPHFKLFNEMNVQKNAYVGSAYKEYFKDYFPENDCLDQVTYLEQLFASIKKDKNAYEPLVVTRPQVKNGWKFLLTDGVHRASILLALGVLEVEAYVVAD